MEFPFFAVLGFAVAASITPGPNTIMVAASGTNHGVTRTVPHMLGVTIGFPVMIAGVGLGLAGPLAADPRVHALLRWVAFAWILFLAWKVATAGQPGKGASRPPLGFIGAALFQWVNPKAWLMAVGAVATYAAPGEGYLPAVLVITGLFAVVGLPCILVWAVFGAGMRQFLAVRWRLRAFNIVMALLLIGSVLPVVYG